ncbi:MAG TPA: hypothetical protein VND23_11375 [Acidimicrobiales bacterium]|nr:hypothetical protein [Acidimicrobiales bacterium]
MDRSATRRAAVARQGRRQVPFVLHEVAEYVVAIALVAVGFHLSGSAQILLVTVGAVMLLLGALTSGRLGACHLLSRRAHHAGDLVLVTVLALSPVVAHRGLHLAGTVLAEAVALVLLRIERGTLYGDAPSGPAAVPAGAGAGTAVATAPAEPAPASPGSTDRAARAGAIAGATAAGAVVAAGHLAPVAGRAAKRGARGLGVVAGMTKRAARERSGARRAERGS